MILAAVESAEPRDGVDAMADAAARDAEQAFGFIAAVAPVRRPGQRRARGTHPRRLASRSAPSCAPATSASGSSWRACPRPETWERADQTLLDLYASEIGVAIRNAELFSQVQDQNQQLRQLSEVKDDFLRGVSHNLQTPLTSIRSNADALATDAISDPRLTIISDQADRLTRMVQQLLLVGRLESQPPRPTADVLAIGPRIQRAWDALAVTDRPLTLHDGAPDWLARRRRRPARPGAVGAARQRREVRRGRGHGRDRRRPRSRAGSCGRRSPTAVAGSTKPTGPGCSVGSSAAPRVGRAATAAASACTCSRALMRGMGGDLVLDRRPCPDRGATFRLTLPGEPANEA